MGAVLLSEKGPEKRAGKGSDSADGAPLQPTGSERALQPERFTSVKCAAHVAAAEADGLNSGAFELRSDDSD